MSAQSWIKDAIYRRIAYPRAARVMDMESLVACQPDAVHAVGNSPTRFEIIGHPVDGHRPPMVLRALPHIAGSMYGIQESLQSLVDNPVEPRRETSPEFLSALERYIRSLGASSIGYAMVQHDWIFQSKTIAHDNAIVFTMEMDREKMELAPHPQTGAMVMETYNRLGRIANQTAGYLRARGYSAHAGHPLMGLMLYPPLAHAAGLGWHGYHGLLITPEHGPRVRIAAVYTSIENLPFATENRHGWVEDFCAVCRRCIRDCPVNAIRDEPIVYENGRLTHVHDERCHAYFTEKYGCSVCIKVCPFSRLGYDGVKRRFEAGMASTLQE